MTSPRFAVLAVCTANICRSPMMEIALRDRLDTERFEVASAGVSGLVGHPMDAMSEMELMRHGLAADTFRSHPIDEYLIGASNLILTATASHKQRILEDEPRAMRRSFTLRAFAELCVLVDDSTLTPPELVAAAAAHPKPHHQGWDVGDPYRRSPRVHRETADQIMQAVGVIADRLNRCPA